MRKSLLNLVPVLFLVACEHEPVAPNIHSLAPTARALSTSGRTDIERASEVIVGYYSGTCPGGFDALSDWTGEFRHSRRYDKDGNLVQEAWVYRYLDGSVYNSVHPEVSLSTGPGETQIFNFFYDKGYFISAGPIARVVVPGVGPIFMDIGMVRIDLATFTITHEGGPHQYWEGDVAALCAALTP
jgi:hypothetical protein